MSTSWEGLLLVDKPGGEEGPTSHDVVAQVRRATGQRRIGHTGTLDPFASGLLALVLGPATRLIRFMPQSPKTYEGLFELGVSTTTDDITGETLERHSGPLPGPDRVVDSAARFLGRSLQKPPDYSARKVRGERLYALARRGIRVEAQPTEIEVFRLEVSATERPQRYRFVAEVSAGTYIRGLARDLGRDLGCGATLGGLRRTRIGPMDIDAALTLSDDVETDCGSLRQALVPPSEMPLMPPPFRIQDPQAVRRFCLGGPVGGAPEGVGTGFFRVLSPGGDLLGVAEAGEGLLRPRVVLAREQPL